MRRFLAPFVSILLIHSLNPSVYAADSSDDEAWNPQHAHRNASKRILLSATTSSSPIVISNAINNSTATIILTAHNGDIPAKTWISFDDGPMVEVDDDLSLESIAAAYNKTVGKNDQGTGMLEPFSFESPFADPVCVFNTTIVKANVTGPSTLSCESPAIDNINGAGVPFYISSNGGHDLSDSRIFAYLSSQERQELLLDPNHGPSSGGTRVVVKGITSGPIVDGPRALCKFGTHISHAIEVGSNGEYIVCSSPHRSANDHAPSVPVDISIVGQSNVFSGVKVVFRYDDEFSVSSLHPTSGLVIGGTRVNIRGGPFQNPDDIVCRFGEKVVDAIYHDVAEISCVSPNLGWIEEVQRVSIFTMAANPEIQTISANVDDYVNEVHICQTLGETDLADDELGRGFRLVAPGGSIEYPLTRHTRWLHFNETADGMKEALTGLFPEGFHVNRTGPFPSQTYRWEIVLPKSESFDGETLHVLNSGGGAVSLVGTNASVSCVLAQRGTQRLGGQFKLFFSNNGSVESSEPIPYNATNEEIKEALEELIGIDRVAVNSASLDSNVTGSRAYQWHVTFDSLKNAGDLPPLMASSDATLLGSNAAIEVKETRKGFSHTIYRIEIPSQATGFNILLDELEGQALSVGASVNDVVEAIEALGGKSIAVEKYQNEYFFLDIMGYPLHGRLKVRLFQCDEEDTPSSCPSELQAAIQHVPSTSAQLGGYFSLQYPSDATTCKACKHSTGPISAYVTAKELESALERLDLIDQVEVVITGSERFEEYKVAVESGIVGFNRNFYIRFVQKRFHQSDLIVEPMHSTSYSGDVPMLRINQANLKGTPTRDAAYSNDYNAKVIEVVKGADLNHGGIVEFAVSINGGVDFSAQNPLFEYKPVPIVQSITPTYGSITGGTAVRLNGDNFSRKSARFCLFWSIGASIVDGVPSGLIETLPISKYDTANDTAIREVTCMTPASLKPQYVHVAVVANEDISTLGGSLQARGELFRYHPEIKMSSVHPASSTVAGNVSVDVFGGPFFSNEGLYCKFGAVSVTGSFQGPRQVSCTTPPHASGSYSLDVTQNGQDYTKSGHVFRFYHTCNVSSISPISGPSKRAGTNVRVYGENFVNTISLQCRFGSVTVPATFVHSSEIHCSSPPIVKDLLMPMEMTGYYPQQMMGRLVPLEVSNNGQDFTLNGHEFLYLEDIEVSRMSRREGPSHGGTPVYVSGSNFVNNTQLMCRFGRETTQAYFLTQDAIICFSLPIYGKNYMNSIEKKVVPLSVSNNAEDYVFFGEFTYSARIPSGTYQAGTEGNNTLLSCSRGAYCSGLLETNFTLCNPGTYQPLTGQSRCIQCPVGYVCNEFGMTVPRICPAHYICDEKGMGNAKPCPTNFICDRGTATLSTSCLKKSFDFGSETCFDNSTDDFGFQASHYPAQVWAERHLMPLDVDAPVSPIRGRYCLDNTCINYEDSDNYEVFDKSFDYSSTGFALRRPKCAEGTNCNPGILPSSRTCAKGHYCRLGIKRQCLAGTYCPHDHVFDPLPCEPGTFNFMIGQEKCSDCPIGFYCPSYGLSDPVACSPGFVCSKKGLASPNIRCPAGFYCQNGTKTSDPFRNDTTLRPYACTPGTFCFAGTGSNEVQEGVVGFAQPCAAGFFCEAASTSAKGSGACPPGFQCPKGTAVPRPTPKGFHAEHPGTIESTACLPGFYAPTIQTAQCYECPPGTSCMFEGLFDAEECGPGLYRSTNDENGHSCVPCPQGTWSKNWGLREKGECTRCPTGVVCPLDGMTNPCSYDDLPTPYEPIVNSKGMPAFEYSFPTNVRPPPFSMDECLALNSDTESHYLFGELVPPYIDILGRGPHFRPSDQSLLKYQSVAKCYKNSQPQGSLVYQRMAEYYGPQYDIQTGNPHQGYGIALLNNQIYATAPPEGYDFSFKYFRGEGNGYIDLPKARVYDPAFNCTKGMQLMNSSLVMKNEKRVVYTDSFHDFEGGYDVEKCPTYDSELGCYIDETYEVHDKGECCNMGKLEQRAIFLAHDQFYRGTCEADLICSEGGSATAQAKPCDYGFVCDEKTSLERSMNYRCPAGFVCDFATTPDTKLQAPGSQLKRLCEEGRSCGTGQDLGQPSNGVCPKNYWCPAGTSDPLIGTLANDGLLRRFDDNIRRTHPTNLHYQDDDTFTLLDDRGGKCNAAILPSLQRRFQAKVQNHTNYLADQESIYPIADNEATPSKEKCARDNKPTFIEDAMRRRECNCHRQFLTLASLYRFWKCTSELPLDDLGFGDVMVPPSGNGKRDFWYPRSRIHKDLESAIATDPAMGVFGLQYGEGNVCKFSDSDEVLSLTKGRLPDEGEARIPILQGPSVLHKHSSDYLELDPSDGFSVRFTSAENRVFESYAELKHGVKTEYNSERLQYANGNRSNIDPFIFDLYSSLQLIEQFGQRLEEFVYLNATSKTSTTSIELVMGQGNGTSLQVFDFAGPLDWCECQNLLRCPNATIAGEGSTSLHDCVSTKNEVLHRISLLPPVNNLTTQPSSTLEGTVDESSTLKLDPFDVAILTVDQSRLPNNITYGDHYRIAIYDECKPCPIRYQCKKTGGGGEVQPSSCHYPSTEGQIDILNECLKRQRKKVCLRADGSHEAVETCESFEEDARSNKYVLFSEPDLDKCMSRPYFCSDTSWNFRSFRRLCQDTQEDGKPSLVYDCDDVHRWNTYSQWRNKMCCSKVPELRGMNSCQDSVCDDDPLIEKVIRQKLIGVFEKEYGFVPPTKEPKGQLLMSASKQEEIDHDHPLDLFNEYQDMFHEQTTIAQYALPHNKYKPDSSQTWMATAGCCKCRRHSMPAFFSANPHVSGFPDDKHQAIQLAISSIATVELTVVVELLHGAFYADFSDYFVAMDKTMLRVHSPSRFAEEPGEKATWLAVIEQSSFDKWNLDLPLNLPTNIGEDAVVNEMETRFFVDRPSNISVGDHRLTSAFGNRSNTLSHPTRDPVDTVLEEDDWWPHDFLALPYVPFFSNCDGFDSRIGLSRLLEEHPDCEGVSYDQTVPTKEYAFFGKHPVSDTCLGAVIHCTYEEEVREARKNLRWFEASPGSTLFHITRDSVASAQFLPSSADEEWGRTSALDDLRNHGLIPVTVDKEMGGYRHTIPRKVQLELKYYQLSKGKKRLVEANMYFEDLCTTIAPEHFGGSTNILDMMQERGIYPCDVDINGNIKTQGYNLEILYYSLGWFDLLNRFEFSGFVYFIFFTLVGLTICSMGGFIYGMNRLLTKLRHPPQFMGSSLVKLVSRPQIQGCSLAVVPFMTVILIVHSLFNDSTFPFSNIHRDWSKGGRVGDKEQIENGMGRLGSAFIVLGFYTVYQATQKLLIPVAQAKRVDDETEGLKGDSGLTARRGHFLFIALSIEAILMCLWEFSYSDIFRDNIYRFKVLFQLCQMLLDLGVSHILGDRLLAAPLLVSIQMAELLVTVGARNFVEFTMSFLVEIALSVVQRLFLYPLIKTIMTLWPRWKLLASQTFGGKGLTRQEKQEREARWKKVNEDIELRSEGVEPLLDSLSIYSVEKTGGIMLPFMCLLLMLLYTETEMAMSYNINQHELLYYALFAGYMIPWMSLVDSFILSSQELLYGWRVHDYFSYQRWRFANRPSRWNLLAHVDESVTPSLQNVDLLCFSSQHYFVLSIIALGFGTNMFGITICLRRKYNFLGDPVFPLIVVIVILCCELIAQVCIFISNTDIDVISWHGIWKVAQLQGTMDDVIASKLAIGEGRQEDLEQERQELQAMNSETFRHKFIEKNRPWVLQHLVEIMTPRALQDVGPDGRPLVDYVREVYSNLMNVGEGINKREDDRSDISSDDYSDEEEEKRRQWDRTPLEGNRLLIAQIWLQKARKRRVFTQAVATIIEKRKEDHCSVCSRTLGNCKSLTAGLAWDGRFDSYAIDNLIKLFEDNYSPGESNPNLWKAFFRENARFSTICNTCLDQIEQQNLHKNVRHVGAGVLTRPGDISSDDESDDNKLFDPVVVVRSSDEGRMMSKWLQAAREKLGGEFPRQSALKVSKEYLDRLKHRKAKTKVSTDDIVGMETNQGWGNVDLDERGEFIVKRWLRRARDSARKRFDDHAGEIRQQLNVVLGSLDVEDDWATGELRLEGNALKIEGDQISRQKETKEAQMAMQIEASRSNYELDAQEIDERKKEKKQELEVSVSQLRDLSRIKKESRTMELNKKIDDLKENNNVESEDAKARHERLNSLINTEMEDEDGQLQAKTTQLTSQFENQSRVLDRELHSALQSYGRGCQVLREKTRKEHVYQESDWQKNVNLWLGKADRKLEAHERDSLKNPAASAKRARLEYRRRRKMNNENL